MKVTDVSLNDDNDLLINLTNSSYFLFSRILFYSLSLGLLCRAFPIEDIIGKVILSIVNEDDVTIVITFSDNYSLLIKLV
jgi:hypothetical protein